MSEVAENVGKQVSLAGLLDEFKFVQIPIIQRDFAQGRPGLEELRREFLSALKTALDSSEDDEKLPLDLDFVYGSGFSQKQNNPVNDTFSPLDGQQRLTTLFLLHWYLAWLDGEQADFQERFLEESRSRFSYEVRPSSHDFFNKLVANFPNEPSAWVSSIRVTIEDKPWFFRSWKTDPTIVSALVVLDEIHSMFKDSKGFYTLLVGDKPRITFQLLELKKFGLSDDLYIKMNARGKALTAFENFKAKLEQHLDEQLPDEMRKLHDGDVSISRYFAHRMDSAWTDLFWSKRVEGKELFDDQVMRLVKAVSLICLDPTHENAVQRVSDLKSFSVNFSYGRLDELGAVNERMLRTLIAVLDFWSGIKSDDWNSKSNQRVLDKRIFESVTRRELTYPELSEFAAYCAFIQEHEDDLDLKLWSHWQRVINNLIVNSDIGRPGDFVDVLGSVLSLEKHSKQILNYFASGNSVSGFNRQQVREERVKAALISRNNEWANLIYSAESHGYFRGQIEFLLKFSGVLDHWLKNNAIDWEDKEDGSWRTSFEEYWKKSKEIFDNEGLKNFPNSKWERALLSYGDYTLPFGGKNKSFLQNKTTSSARRPTWKLLLRGHTSDTEHEAKRELVRTVFDAIDLAAGTNASLNKVIKQSEAKGWRKLVVNFAEMIAFCGERMFRIDEGRVYLISKVRTRSDYCELNTYHIFLNHLPRLKSQGKLSPFDFSYSYANTNAYVPSITFNWKGIHVEVDYENRQYRFACNVNDGNALVQKFLEKLRGKRELTKSDVWRLWRIKDKDILESISELAAIAKECE